MSSIKVAIWLLALATAGFVYVVGIFPFGHRDAYLFCTVVLLLAWWVVGQRRRAAVQADALKRQIEAKRNAGPTDTGHRSPSC
jgi:hypothetical protein